MRAVKPFLFLTDSLAPAVREVAVRAPGEMAARIAAIDPDVILIDLENPNRDTIEQMFRVSREVKRPIAMFVDESDPETTKSAIRAGVSAYIIDGLRRDRIQPVVDVAISRFESYRELEQRATDAELQLAERKTIERAKALLMEKRAMTEPDAYEAQKGRIPDHNTLRTPSRAQTKPPVFETLGVLGPWFHPKTNPHRQTQSGCHQRNQLRKLAYPPGVENLPSRPR